MVYTFYLPTKIIFGCGCLGQLGVEAKDLGQKAMVVTYPVVMRQFGILGRVTENLKSNGVEALIFEKVEANPLTQTVDEGAKIAREEKVDIIIGLGGGSAMDTAKGIAVSSSGTEPFWRYVKREVEVKPGSLPIIQIPTTASTGSETNSAMAMNNPEAREKMAFNVPQLFARVAVVDPELTVTTPSRLTAQGGVDMFCSAAELYITAEKPSPLTDGILEAIMKMVVEYLPKALAKPDDIEARTQLSWAATIYSSQIARIGGGAGYWTCHSIEQAVSSIYHIAHGDGLAALLPAWMEYTLPATRERFSRLGRDVFDKDDGLEATTRWLEKIGMRLKLKDFGVELERAGELAALAIKTAIPSGPFEKHPNSLDAERIAQIIRAAH